MPIPTLNEGLITTAFDAVNGTSPDALEQALIKSSLNDLSELMNRVTKDPTALQKLRNSPLMQEKMKTAAMTAREEALKESRKAIENIKDETQAQVDQRIKTLQETTQTIIAEHKAILESIITQNTAPAARPANAVTTIASNKVGAFASKALTYLSGVPGIGWIFAPFAANAASDTQGTGMNILERSQEALYVVGANLMKGMPFLSGFAETFQDGANRFAALRIVRKILPSFDANSASKELVKAFIGGVQPPKQWQAELAAQCAKIPASVRSSTAPITWTMILEADKAEAQQKTNTEAQELARIRASFDNVETVTLKPGRDLSAIKNGGKFALIIGREMANTTTGALGKEATRLKEHLKETGASLHSIDIVAANDPLFLEKQSGQVTIKMPMNMLTDPDFTPAKLKLLVEMAKRNDAGIKYFEYKESRGSQPTMKLIQRGDKAILTWNTAAQTHATALDNLPTQLTQDTPPNTEWTFEGTNWNPKTTPVAIPPTV